MDRFDVIVIGAGMAGINAAGRAHDEGARVAVIERDRVGGTCPIRGCIPTKALVRAAEIAHDARRAHEFGVRVDGVEVDFAAVMRRVRDISDRGADGARDYLESLERLDLVIGEAAFTEPGVVEVDGRRLAAPSIVIATGAEPVVPPIPGLADTPYLTSDDVVLRIDQLPDRLLVIGAGPIGLELGQALSRLGSTVTLIEIGPRLLEGVEPEVGDALAERLAGESIELLVGVEIARVGMRDGGAREVLVDVPGERRTLTGDAILLGTGRAPALERLRLENAGVELNRRGVRVDRTLAAGEGVLAAGDAVGAPYGAFTHVARRMGGVAGANAVDGGSREVDPDVGPRAIFTDPEVATIGFTEAAAREAGHEVSVGVERFAGGKARAWGEEHGLAKVVCEAGTDRILGAAVLAYHAADLIHPVAVAMQAPGASARPLIDAYHVHPTMGEVVQRAARLAEG